MWAMTQFTRNFQGIIAGGLLSLVVLSICAASARAQSGLKVINPPQGGRAVYGQIPGESTEAQAMGWILRSLHQEFGDRPGVGKLFQVHGPLWNEDADRLVSQNPDRFEYVNTPNYWKGVDY